MRITVHADYAMRVLMYLALQSERRAVVNDIAAAYRISSHHLDKVVQRLARAGFITTQRGSRGGIALAMEPGAITLGAVVRIAEDDFALVECLGHARFCRIAGVCRMRGAFTRALDAFFAELDAVTLASLVEHPAALRGALDLNALTIPIEDQDAKCAPR
jgi:Rrf2 family nitric oxide-sensitive transcriptional repressor